MIRVYFPQENSPYKIKLISLWYFNGKLDYIRYQFIQIHGRNYYENAYGKFCAKEE